jgi:arylsulfatase A-like enzyme
LPEHFSSKSGKQASASKVLVETVDIYPTLAVLARLPVPEGLDGKSFAAVLDDPTTAHRNHAIHVYLPSPGWRPPQYLTSHVSAGIDNSSTKQRNTNLSTASSL